MKIVKIKKDNEIYEVSFEPTFFEKLLNIKKYIKAYKKCGEFKNYSCNAYCDETGKIEAPLGKITKALEEFNRRF
ncbi:MAG: hypothetical protein ACXAC7_23550 [Candidatus Hodarchaeales archaeon]|jgi:hypothetical protein